MGESIEQELIPGEMMDARELARHIYIGTVSVHQDVRTMSYTFVDENGNAIDVSPDVYKNIVDCLEGRL